MADIRINALATTAASTASDDFLPVDGAAQGTRKLNAYSPTFGGNLTVSGGTITGGTSGMSLAAGGTNQKITLTPSGNGFAEIVGGSLAVATFIKGGGFAQGVSLGTTGSVPFLQGYASNTFGSFANLTLQPSGSNVLIGTTTDGGQKLQVSGDIAVGSGNPFSNAATKFSFTSSTNYAALALAGGAGTGSQIDIGDGAIRRAVITGEIDSTGNKGKLIFRTNAGSSATSASDALTLDSGQNATFAGTVTGSGGFVGTDNASNNAYLFLARSDVSFSIANETSLRIYSKAGRTNNAASGGVKLLEIANTTGNATFTGNVTVQGTTMTLSGSTFGIDMGAKGSANNPFFDFNSSGNNNDFDVRLQAKGGGAGSALGTLTLHATTVATASNAGAFIIGDSGTGTPTSGTAVAIGGGKIFTGSDVTVGGAIAIGNTVQTAVSVASTHKVTISIGGSTYYLLATNV